MSNVLLITDTARVKKIFEAIEATGILQLRSAATLAQGDLEIAASPPGVTFIQSRISGFSGEIVLQHLRKTLPAGSRLILLAGDAGELEYALRQGERYLDLTLGDQALTCAIHDALSGVFAVPAPQAPHAEGTFARSPAPDPAPEAPFTEALPPVEPPPVKERLSLRGKVTAASPAKLPFEGFSKLPAEGAFLDAISGAEESAAPRPAFEELLQGKEQASSAYAYPELSGDFSYGKPLAEAMRSAEQEKRSGWLLPVAGGLAGALIVVSVVCFYAGRKAGLQQMAALPKTHSRAASHAAPAAASVPAPPRAPSAAPVVSVAQAPAPAAKGSSPSALTPTAAKPVAVPVAPAAKSPAQPLAAKPAPVAAPQSGPKAPAAPQPKAPPLPTPTVAKVAPAPQGAPAAPRSGVKTLPAVVAAARLDAAYGKKHPGWQRYVGAGADFKVFREASQIKALQVIAKGGQSIPDPLLQRVLHEFAGIDGYQVHSKGVQKNYLVERGTGQGGVAVTVYRKKEDQRMKALVLYYR